MITYINDCVGCPQGCIHCGNDHRLALYCDICNDEVDQLHDVNGDQVCDDCLLKMFPLVAVD